MRHTREDGRYRCWFYGRRYNVEKLGNGWALVDTRPDEPGYVFRRGRRVLYAAKILGEAYSAEAARELVKRAKELEATNTVFRGYIRRKKKLCDTSMK